MPDDVENSDQLIIYKRMIASAFTTEEIEDIHNSYFDTPDDEKVEWFDGLLEDKGLGLLTRTNTDLANLASREKQEAYRTERVKEIYRRKKPAQEE